MKLKDKVALVTGAGSGIGRACALWLAEEGAEVAIADLNLPAAEQGAQEVRGKGRRALAVRADVADSDQVADLAQQIIRQFGRVDILVNNAGRAQPKPFTELTEADWDRMIDVHLKGTFNCTKAVIEGMISHRWGRIISIASTAGLTGTPNHIHYSAAKAGIIGFTKALAKDMAPFGITLNAVAPGIIETPILSGVPEDLKQLYISRTPVGRMGRPEDIAAVVTFLATDDAGFITGQVISPNGGYFI